MRTSILGALAATLALAGCPNFTGKHQAHAEAAAKAWARENDLNLVSDPRCNSVDSDNDGYVSCSFRFEGEPLPRTFECAGWDLFIDAEGCREPKMNVRSTVNVHNHQ